MKKKDIDLFNPAFEGLKEKIKQTQEKPAASPKEDPRKNALEEEMGFFLDAMAGATPIPEDKRRSLHGPGYRAKPSHPPTGESRQVMDQLQGDSWGQSRSAGLSPNAGRA